MSRLASLLLRAAEARGVTIADDAAAAADGGGGSGGLAGGKSVYGTLDYWEGRYEEGVIGASARKGVLSNEWCEWGGGCA